MPLHSNIIFKLFIKEGLWILNILKVFLMFDSAEDCEASLSHSQTWGEDKKSPGMQAVW